MRVRAAKLIGAHRLVSRDAANRNATTGCRILFVALGAPAPSDNSHTSIVPALLTVSDAPDFLAKGGIIELFTEDNRLRFNISVDNARQAGLLIGSDLLQLAALVEEKKR